MALPYRNVKDIYDTLHDAGAVSQSLPDWSTEMNALSHTDLYNAGLQDNFIKQGSVGIDRLLEASGLPNALGQFGSGVGSLVGNAQAGQQIGQSIPRMAVNFAPLAVGAAFPPAAPAMLGLTGALSGAETYTNTGSPAAGVVSGLTNVLMPGVASLGEKAAFAGLGGKVFQDLALGDAGQFLGYVDRAAGNVAQHTGGFLGGQAAAAGFGELSSMAQAGLDPNGQYHFSPSEALLNMTLGQLPFAAAHLAGKVVGKSPDPSFTNVDALIERSQQQIQEQQVRDAASKRSPIEDVPDVTQEPVSPTIQAQLSDTLAKIRGEKAAIVASGDADSARKLSDLDDQELSAMEQTQGQGVLGEQITPDSERVNVVGTPHFFNPKTGYRIIKVGEDVANREAGFTPGDLIGYSTKNEQPPVGISEGAMQFDVPVRYHTKGVKDNRPVTDAANVVERPNPQQDLPTSQSGHALDQARQFSADLADVKSRLESVPDGDTEGLRQGIEAYNGVRQKYGYEPLNDAKVAELQNFYGTKSPSDAVKGSVNKFMLRMAQKEQALRDQKDLLAKWVNDPVHGPEIMDMYNATEAGRAGSFEKALRRWVADGTPGGIEGLRSRAIKAKEKGGDGAPKVAGDVPKKTAVAAKEQTPATDHVRDIRQNVAETVTESQYDDPDAAQWRQAFADGTIESDPKLRDFASDPQVREWTNSANAELQRLGQHNAGDNLTPAPRIPAGGGFIHDFVPYDEATNKLGKHTLPKTGVLAVSQFKNMGKEQGTLPDVAIQLGKLLVPEAFGTKDGTETVNVPVLMKGLREKGPVVEVKKLGDKPGSTKFAEITHNLDTRFPGWRDIAPDQRPTEMRALVNERTQAGMNHTTGAAAKYSFLGPKSEQEMPGYVEGLVRVPISDETKQAQEKVDDVDTQVLSPKEEQDRKQIKYRGPHFGSEDTNVLAFYRGYEENVNGKKVFHIIEVQSDWGQRVQKAEKDKFGGIGDHDVSTHPLLSVYEPLALKAAIDHAQSIGADAIMLSDGETTMMTEGHDKASQNEYRLNKEGGEPTNWTSSNEHLHEALRSGSYPGYAIEERRVPSQDAGMRLHYDTTLPSAMAKLTGEKGERVEVGSHKQAREAFNGDPDARPGDMDWEQKSKVTGSPVFRNPDGTPKSSISGRLYPLDKIAAKADSQGGLTLTDPSRAPGGVASGQPTPFVAQTWEEKARLKALAPDSGGPALISFLQKSPDPVTKTLADTLAKNFPEALKRIFVRIMDMSGEGRAGLIGNREAVIHLSSGNLMTNDTARGDQVKMHELFHGLTLAELDNPTKKPLVDELEAQRQRLINTLPEAQRDKLRSLIADDWISKFGRGEATMEDLSKSPGMQQVMYGLMNNKELVTQGYTDKSMRTFMGVLRGPGGKKGFGVFVDWVKRFLGFDPKTSDSELAHFVDITSRIMQQGEYVSDVSNFTDHWFAQKGYAPGLVREQSRKALEVIQSTGLSPSKELMLHTLGQREPITKEYQDAKRGVEEMWKENGPEAAAAKAVLGELKTPVDSIEELATQHLVDPLSDMRDAMDMLPDAVTKLMFEKVRDMKDVLDSVNAAVTEKNDGLLNLVDPKDVRGPVRSSLKAINDFLKIENEHEVARTQLVGMQRVAPDAFFDSVLKEPSLTPSAPKKGILDSVGEAIGSYGGRSFEHFLQQPAQIARSNPIFGEWYFKAAALPTQVRNMAAESMRIFGHALSPDGVVAEQPVREELQRVTKAVENTALRKTLNKLIRLKQDRGGRAVGPIDYKDPEVVKLLSGLSEADQNSLINLDNKVRLTKVAADQQTLLAMQQDYSTLAARGVMRDTGMKMEPAVDAANKVFDAIAQAQTNPQVSQALLAGVQSKMQIEPFLRLLKFTQNNVSEHQEYSKYLTQNTDWVSANRYGTYLFQYLKDGHMYRDSAENMEDAKRLSGGRDILDWKKNDRSDNDAVFLGSNAVDVITKLREFEQNRIEMMRASGASEEEIQNYNRISEVPQFERYINAQQAVKNVNLEPRNLSKLPEDFPFFSNHLDWIQKNASYWQRRLLKTQGDTMLLEPGTAGTVTADLIKQHMSELLQRDPEMGRKIQQVAFTWSLGFNPATIMANATQTYMRGVTELIRAGHGPIAALREISGAWRDFTGHKVGDKPYRTPEEEAFIKGALHDGQIDATIFDDNAAANEAASVNFKRVINKERPQTIGQHIASAFGAYSTAGTFLFRHGERANNEVTLLAAFRALKKLHPDMPEDALKKQAYLINASANDVGGRANRSLGLYSGTGDFARTVAMTASSLQSYLLGSTFQLIRNLKAGVFRPAGLTPAEVFSARKAAVYQLAVQFAAAGTLGMPFVSGALALLNQAFPELELNKKLRESVSSLMGGDTGNGHILTDMAMSGVPSMLGWDFSSRLSAGNVLPGVSEYNGFQPEQLLGVPGSLITNWVNGAKKLASGDPQGGYAFVPPAFRGLAKLWTGDATKDYRGRPVLTPTPGENVGLALGFQPKRLSDYNAADRMAQQSDQLQSRRAGQVNQQLAEEAMKGNFGTVRASLQQQMQLDKSYNPVDAVKAIARAAEEMTFPKDLRQQGNAKDADSRSRLLSSFSIDPSSTSEVQRLQFRQGIEQRLGLNVQDSHEVALAQVMDQMRQQNPDAIRASLRVQAEQMLRRTSSSRQVLQPSPGGSGF